MNFHGTLQSTVYTLQILHSTEKTCACVHIVCFIDYCLNVACSSSTDIHNTYTYKHAKCPSIMKFHSFTEQKYVNMILSFRLNKQR